MLFMCSRGSCAIWRWTQRSSTMATTTTRTTTMSMDALCRRSAPPTSMTCSFAATGPTCFRSENPRRDLASLCDELVVGFVVQSELKKVGLIANFNLSRFVDDNDDDVVDRANDQLRQSTSLRHLLSDIVRRDRKRISNVSAASNIDRLTPFCHRGLVGSVDKGAESSGAARRGARASRTARTFMFRFRFSCRVVVVAVDKWIH